MKKKKRTKRSKVENPALDKHYIAKIKQEYLDYDYIKKLSDKDKNWLNRFTEEFLNANFKYKGRKLTKDPSIKKQSYHRNNARQRCMYSRAKARNAIIDLPLGPSEDYLTEDLVIEMLDNINSVKDTDDQSN